MRWRTIFPFLALLLGGCLAPGGDVPPPPVQEDVLKAGDRLSITVSGEEDLSGGFAVNSDGLVQLDLLGGVPAAGLSVAAFQEQVRQRLAAGYLIDPHVRVARLAQPPGPLPAALPALRPSQ
jgi:polysaccharide export outer membrane protein